MGRPVDLADRLRRLRVTADATGLAPAKLSQGDLARAFGVSTPLVSAWEKPVGATRPTDGHLDKYARLFATARSFAGDRPRPLELEDLTAEERDRYYEIKHELGLTEPADPLWFPDGIPVTIVCAEQPEKMRAAVEYADPLHPDHIELYSYADPDALFELHGYLGRVNPDTRVRYKLVTRLTSFDLDTHLVVLGGVDFNTLTRQLMDRLDLPVAQVGREGLEAGAFAVTDADGTQRTLVPELKQEGGRLMLREDVAHLCRAPNPFSRRDTTVTIFNGMYGRGTLGIVRALTGADGRDANFRYLERRFGGSPRFSLVCRVPVVAGVVTVPDLSDDRIRLHEWPEPMGGPIG
ncbi:MULTISPECIES: helix-turn-helix domain-containing protein [Dactylosporangium]|uniref:HTH cro/C1-type domain-containing protein n=2 Tax=Dactylosporangium TaxID=35753 RepID=A0A9W6KEH7_9ACTN|nr:MULTISPECIES: helix-turn-helix transcriptional regulator [Dactylosporangium]UAB96046.1 helix-turn-helix transcriptional regulator [Dactylosporangium vinaceum]UWZ44414.1 helix-turn-helix transcriptional regulator [Dactylosporangium matsuzakiense]GLK99421.1 hypothetical protein GCM10017581_011620 [Dactylosporangium matsuzakiense]